VRQVGQRAKFPLEVKQCGWIVAGEPFQRDDGDEGGGMPIPQIVRQWNKAG